MTARTVDEPVLDPQACRVCGSTLTGAYCQACGQPSTAVRRSMREALLGQTGRIVHTLSMLLLRPGELGREIAEGRDRLSVRPVTLLFNLIAVFFVVGASGGFSATELMKQDESSRLSAQVAARAMREGVPLQLAAERVDRHFQTFYSLLIPLSAFVYGGVFWVLHRRARQSWLVHLAGGVHYLCFVFLWAAALYLAGRLLHFNPIGHPAVWVSVVVNVVYLVLMQRRTYADSWPAAGLKSALIALVGTVSDNLLLLTALSLALLV